VTKKNATPAASTKKPKRVAQYIRVSTLEQAREGNSLEGQKDALAHLIQSNAKDNLWRTSEDLIYIDDGFSGADDERPAYRRMMEDVRKGKFEIVLVWKIDRLFRKTILLLGALEELKKYNIEFVSKNENIDTSTSMGRFTLTLLGAIAEMERETIKERTIMGKIASAKKGNYVGGKYPPFGYDLNKNGKMIVNKDEAKIVKRIFDMFTKGSKKERKTQSEIAKILTAERKLTKADIMGVKRRTNEPGYWAQAAVSALLRKDEYQGTYYYGKRETYVDEYGKKKQRDRPREEWIPLKCPKIVDKDVFEKAQKLMRENEQFSKRVTDHVYLLRSKVHCGECEGRYQGYPKKKKGILYFNYHCSRKNPGKSEKPCHNKEISEIKLDALVWEPIDQLLKDPKTTLKALDAKIRKESKAAEYVEQIKQYQTQLSDKEKEQERLVAAMKRGTLKEALYDKEMGKTNAEIETIQNEITHLEQLIVTEQEQEELKNSLAKLSQAYRKKYGKIDRVTKEAIIRKLVNKVTIYPSGQILVDYAIEKIQKRVNKHGGDAGT